MKRTDIAIIGGGPAGLCASIAAAKMGAKVTLIERNSTLGGQLVKQTHMFFGSQKQYASTRGIDICKILDNEVNKYDNIEVLTNTTVLGMYEDGVITLDCNGSYKKMLPSRIIVATGASEKYLPFANNDLPGIYGAGAVQTLMNVYGVKPADSVVMVGAGNIGLIVSYQLMQAGVSVNAIIDAAPSIGGYLVHASKVARLGVPILTSTTVKSAHGKEYITGITTVKLDDKWQEIEGSESYLPCDNLCISVGLSPLAELLWQIGCEMKYVPTLGGFVPTRDNHLKTSIDSVYVAGDVAGIEEASSAMVEGSIAGLCASRSIGLTMTDYDKVLADYIEQSNSLRRGPVGDKIRQGLAQVEIGGQTK
ncbi:MAG: NAD(P)/FAD-dependent oxidoreductase [Clostridia bacterium]|nr:NAD(P)/FAD-dependent oxidoreductase [Clostridia bacterium]